MTRVRSFGWAGCGLAIVLLTGCEGQALQIEALQQRVNDLEKENYGLQSQLAAAKSDADEARRWAAQLQQELADARGQLASVETLPEGWQTEGGIAWKDLGVDILFDPGKATLKSGGRAQVERVAQEIQTTFPDRDIWVVGHTDSDPIKVSARLWKDNLDLSLNRAAAVARELYKLGLDPKHVIAGGQGEFNPLAPNDTKAGKAQNRRVQIMAVLRQGGGASAASPTVSEPVESPPPPAEQPPPEK